MFKKVCIIGCGLIGSSLARAIKKNNLAEKIVSSNRSDAVNKKVIELKIVDDSSSDTKKMADGSDLVVIATPLSSYEDVISKIKNSLITKIPDLLRQSQSEFSKTGGIHASALFNKEGKPLVIKEDVGRHNALDKVIGHSFNDFNQACDTIV